MRRFLIVSGFLLLACELAAQVSACYRGDPGYGLPPLGPGPDGIVETASDTDARAGRAAGVGSAEAGR